MGCMAAVYSNGGDIGRMSWDISIETLSPSSLRGRADDLSAVEPTTAPNKPAAKQTTAADNSRWWGWVVSKSVICPQSAIRLFLEDGAETASTVSCPPL